jgi:CMP-N-acetylneuraminic acid synthetase
MKIIAVIPARGGSKGIPRKNLQDILGIPLIARKILQAKSSICSEVWVTTEDTEISEISEKYGAKIVKRPIHLSSDEASTIDTILHTLEFIKCDDDDLIVLLQATSPLVMVSTINLCVEKLISETHLNSVITIKDGHPFIWETSDGYFWNPNGHSRSKRARRQDLKQSGWETGGCYVVRAQSLRDKITMYPEPTGTVSVNALESIDIDTYEDLEIVRRIVAKGE